MTSSTLADGARTLGVALPPAACEKLLVYLSLVERWSRVYNLTAIREAEKMITHHLLDSLAVLPHISGPRVLDVGSGAGLPGIPLAIAAPELELTLIESSHKKASFLKQALIELGLDRVAVVNERVETYEPAGLYDVVISRAFSDLGEFVHLAGRLCAPGGKLAAMKGVYPYEELAQLPAGYALGRAVRLKVPGLEAERHLLLLERTG